MISFASDNNSGVHPKIMEALAAANSGHCVGYGDDDTTRAAVAALQKTFGDCDPYFVFLGTAANVLGIKAVARSHHSVLCADSAHINKDECGAPEAIAGAKLLSVPAENGKISPQSLEPFLSDFGFEHHNQPRVVSITQCTEYGTVYSPDEVRALADFAHANGMILHMDGARLANAAVALGLSLKQATADLGVDVLSFGGTKNGLMFGEAVIFFEKELAKDFKYIRKQGMQLSSKMRFISAQFLALLEDELWKKNAEAANAAAALLRERIAGIEGVELTKPVETNHVFARLDAKAIGRLRKDYFFYVWNPQHNEVRWVTSFDHTPDDIEQFVAALRKARAAL